MLDAMAEMNYIFVPMRPGEKPLPHTYMSIHLSYVYRRDKYIIYLLELYEVIINA